MQTLLGFITHCLRFHPGMGAKRNIKEKIIRMGETFLKSTQTKSSGGKGKGLIFCESSFIAGKEPSPGTTSGHELYEENASIGDNL